MPPVSCNKDDLDELYEHVKASVVSVTTYNTDKYKLDFLTGFIIWSDRKHSLICVHQSAIDTKKTLYVHLTDGTIEKASMVQRSPSPSGHVVLMTTTESGQARKTVSFRTTEAMREDIFVIAEVEGGYRGFNMLTGTIISPSCKSKDPQSGEVILGSEHRFALSCAAANIIGAAVFDFNCLLVGTVSEFDDVSYDLNYALQSCHWVKQLEESLKAVNSKISLSKDMKINILETRKRKRNISKA